MNRLAPENALSPPQLGLLLSMALHVALIVALFLWSEGTSSVQIIAAGPGEGGQGGGSIEVGVADLSAILGFAKPQSVSFLGQEDNPINNVRLIEAERRAGEKEEALLPPTDANKPDPTAIKTERPVAPQQERIYTGRQELGRAQGAWAQVGRSFGTPVPAMLGGIGLGAGQGLGTGLPGGSEYGRRIQAILSRNYNPPAIETSQVHYVIIVLRIARDGRILSIINGRIAPAYVKQRSNLDLVNRAAERAILASDPLPPFPAGFLAGANEAVAEVWFRYPK
jgi:hypothetical protein